LCWKEGNFWHVTFGNETGFTKVATGESHACGLKNQQLICKGRDHYGQASPPSGNFIDVSAGKDSTCAINTNGEIQCFGKGYENYVGDEMFGIYDSSIPNGTFVEVSVGPGTQACAISTTGDIHCWGLEMFFEESHVREGPFIHVNVYFNGICGIRTNHTVECWGKRLVFYDLSSSVLFSELSIGIDNACGVENGTNLLKCELTGPNTNMLSIPNDFEVYMDQ
jgi:alpha-tubulin suppressor-like RCC1 family protein